MMRALFCLARWCLLVATAAPAAAQTETEATAWPAVGRVTIGRLATPKTCTGALIAPDLVLTAAHCVSGFRPGGKQSDPGRIFFAAGWNDGTAVSVGRGLAVSFPPDYAPGRFEWDMAVIRLSRPITDIVPLPLGRRPAALENLGFAAYSNANLDQVTTTRGCLHMRPQDGLLFLACGVIGGNSGAPVLAGDEAAPHIVGVVVARATGGAFASATNEWLFSFLP